MQKNLKFSSIFASAFAVFFLPFLLKGEPSSFARIVGSTAVFPFSALIAERLPLLLDLPAPIIERTGTGAGVNLFCGGAGLKFPDGVNTSRPLQVPEKNLCARNNVTDILEIKLGYGGIVLVHASFSKFTPKTGSFFPPFSLTLKELFKALSKEVLINGQWVRNPYTTWREINPAFPDIPILIFGPPSTSGIRDSLKEIVFEPFCASQNSKTCGLFREDGRYVEIPENTMLIIQKLETNQEAIGILGYPFLDQNRDALKGVLINGITPSLMTILDGTYPLSRPLYLYLKIKNLQENKILQEYVYEFMDEAVSGEEGILAEKGLIPLRAEEKVKLFEEIRSLLKNDSSSFSLQNESLDASEDRESF